MKTRSHGARPTRGGEPVASAVRTQDAPVHAHAPSVAQRQILDSPRLAAQRARIDATFGPAIQREVLPDGEELQMQALPGATQRQPVDTEEAPVQGRFSSGGSTRGVVQRYVDALGVRTADDGSIALAGPQELYAREARIHDANQKLSAVASGLGAFISLAPGAAWAANGELKRVSPEWKADRGRGSVNHKRLHEAQQPLAITKTQNDCYMTASLAAGIDDRETGTGETTYGKYRVKDRHDGSGAMSLESSAPLDAKEMEQRGVAKPTLAGGGLPYQAAIRNLYRFYMLSMPVFRDAIDHEYRDGSDSHAPDVVNTVRTSIIVPIGEAQRKAGPGGMDDPTALQMALQSYLRIYAAISGNPALKTRFSSMFGVNEAVQPEVGDALAIMNDPKERDAIAERIKGGEVIDELWNYHFAGVVMKDALGHDFVTLENAADDQHLEFNTDWAFYMYGMRADNPDQTFHGALKRGEHGPGIGQSPLTMAFTSGTAPKATVRWPAANSVITSSDYTVNIQPEGPVNNVRVRIDAGEPQQARFESGRWYFDWRGYEEGLHKITVEAWNQAGQRTESSVRVTYTPT